MYILSVYKSPRHVLVRVNSYDCKNLWVWTRIDSENCDTLITIFSFDFQSKKIRQKLDTPKGVRQNIQA